MLTRLARGHVIDPVHGRDGIGDVWIRDGRIVAPPSRETRADETYDLSGKIVMAGAIDIHSHIAGGNVNTARLLLPEQHRAARRRARADAALDCRLVDVRERASSMPRMGFTTVVEPAVAPHHALHAHLELADIPIIDKGTLSVLGNDDFLLDLLRDSEGASAVRDYVAWTLATHARARRQGDQCRRRGGVQGQCARFSLDDVVPYYGVTSRQIVKALQRAVHELGVPHPLHVHCNNLGMPGNADTALATIAAAEDLPLHLAHLQFYGYGKEGERGFSSAAARLAEAVNARRSRSPSMSAR